MLVNIIDDRGRRDSWRQVRTTVAPAANEWIAGREAVDTAFLLTPQQRPLSVAAAVQWAQRRPFGVDLYLADVAAAA